MKVLSAIDSAFNAAELAAQGAGVKAPHGILDFSAEQTLRNVGRSPTPA
jgi:L-cysteine desulfidase